MALGRSYPARARAARSVRIAVVALLLVAAGVAALLATGRLGSTGVAADELSRVVLVAAAPDENGAVVAQVITVVDVSGAGAATLEPVSPALTVTIPGTTYTTLGDAYPFGGGAGVSSALARSQSADPLPYVALNARALTAALEQAGSVTLTLPVPISVFDGEDLFTFSSGRQRLDARELGAVFKGAPYLTGTERAELDSELSAMLASLVAQTSYDAVDTDLSREAYGVLQFAL